jgi:signal transduction histidine kinase/ActR/RegA family two-component response regulator
MFRLPITRTGFAVGIVLLAFCGHGAVSVCIWRRLPYYDINHCGNSIGDIRETTSGMSESSGGAGAPWALRGLVVATVLLPLLVLAGGGWLAWDNTIRETNATLESALAVSAEQATRVLDTHVLLGGRVNDLIGDLDDGAVIAREGMLHDRLAAMIAGYGQVTALVVTGPDGHALVATSRFPTDHGISFSDREYFKALRDGSAPFQIGGVVLGRVTRSEVFTVAVRRGSAGTHFDGAILIGVSPSYFSKFDSDLFSGDTDYTAQLLRDDGTPLAGYPEPTPAQGNQRDRLLVDAFAHAPQSGLVRGPSSIDGAERVVAYRRLSDYPVYVAVGRRWSAVIGDWRAIMATHLIFGVPATLALLALSLLAMRQWRRQHDTLAQLRGEVHRREEAEEALRQSQKMEAVGRLTGGIAHDFNNHLTVISSNIELLQRRLPPDSGSLTRLTEAAMAGVQRAATLTHRLLAFSRQQPLEPEPLDAGRLVSGMLELMRRTLGEDVAIETVLAGSLWQTRVDANQLENVVLNLAVNARDAMPTGGRLTIETANTFLDEAYAAAHDQVSAGQYVMLSVTDTGTGMTQDVISKVFEPFFTTKPLGQGTGLGLSMVYGFVKQSGGHVTIDSEPGHGCTVKVYLPRFIRPETQPAEVSDRAARVHSCGSGETILVVEDDEEVRRASTEALREIGYQVLEAGDAMEGVRLIVDRGGIDLLFTDIGLPGGVNGRALADAARSAQPGVRVLFTTGYTRSADLQDGALDRGVHFIAKPFNLDALAEKIREVLAEPGSVAKTRVEG